LCDNDSRTGVAVAHVVAITKHDGACRGRLERKRSERYWSICGGKQLRAILVPFRVIESVVMVRMIGAVCVSGAKGGRRNEDVAAGTERTPEGGNVAEAPGQSAVS